ncbi:MAG: DUF2959 domain-containing protein [Candidatus Sumerlaeia bacterium]|nr:DUF2959 domain-containing protein [Candidatus Sumerlaeia bacterium]
MTLRPLAAAAMLGLLAATAATTGCSSTYYRAMESFGVQKRDLLVDRVESARDAQEAAKEQFQTALERFKATVAFDGGSLEQAYNSLQREYDRSKDRADAVKSRIESIESVAEALFEEWDAELEQYSDPSLRRSSEQQLNATRSRYAELLTRMKDAERSMQPVLRSLGDRTLFLKHNLNAAAIASLQDEAVNLEKDIDGLVRDMERAINEANDFISQMQTGS